MNRRMKQTKANQALELSLALLLLLYAKLQALDFAERKILKPANYVHSKYTL